MDIALKRENDCEADRAELEALGDLDAPSLDEVLVQSEGGRGSDAAQRRQVLQSVLRYIWESYRTTLELARNSSRLEPLYAVTAKRAFDFCARFSRKPEAQCVFCPFTVCRQHAADPPFPPLPTFYPPLCEAA